MDPSGIIWDVTKCFCGCLKSETAYVYDLEENLQSLEEKERKLEAMKKDVEAYIEEAENTREMERSHQVNIWLKKVEAIQEEIKDVQVHGDREIENKCLNKRCPKNCKSSYKLGKKIAKILKDVDEQATEGERFCKDLEIAHKLPLRPVEMSSEEIVGLDFMFDKVWNSIEAKAVGIIGLYGMGGVGKTTLLKKINNEMVKRSDFGVVTWVVVSKDPNLDNIMGNIRQLVGIGDDLWNHCRNQDEKAAKIYEVLKQKKFVLLLDDLWERLDLKRIGVPHPKETNFQSKLLFTTRSKDLCAKMKAQEKFEVQILLEREALELFCMKVGDETLKANPIIPKLAEEMAKECKGLPLALIVVGSAMAGVESVEAWEHSKNNLTRSSWTASDLETKVFSILKFSYDRLPDETHKKCFLYCALYPEDYEIRVFNLIEKWIGEGFLYNDGANSVRDMRSYGGSIIEKLKLSCLLESVEDDIFLNRTVKMHDVIRDMALWLARDRDKNNKRVIVNEDASIMSQGLVGNLKVVKRISIIDASSKVPIMACPNLITLTLNVNEIIGWKNLRHLKQLKVLELSHVKNKPIEIGGSSLLEYLSLSGGSKQPSMFSIKAKNLINLKVLSWEKTIGGIPLGVISNLQQLKVLRFKSNIGFSPDSGEEREFLKEVESLSNLEELWIAIRSEEGLNELVESTKLQSCVCSLELYAGKQINMPLLLVSLSKMKQLQVIIFEHLSNVEDSSSFGSCCLSMLRHVTISACTSILHLTWLKYAPLLQQLHVEDCLSIEEVIKGEETKDEKGRENVDSIFSSLVDLTLHNLRKLKRIHERVLSFPSLRFIKISECGNLKKLPFDSNSAKHKLRHIRGLQNWWDNLEWDDQAVKAIFQSKFKVLY